MDKRPLKTKGFTLVELLIALTVTVAIGGAIAALLPRAFSIVGEHQRRVNLALDAQTLDAEFDRDFSSLVPQLGFDGDRGHCAFWTLRQTAKDGFALCHVSYEATKDGVLLTATPPLEYLQHAETNNFPLTPRPIPQWASAKAERILFHTKVSPYAFGGTNTEEQVIIGSWSNMTNAPSRIATTLSLRKGEKIERLYYRRTHP